MDQMRNCQTREAAWQQSVQRSAAPDDAPASPRCFPRLGRQWASWRGHRPHLLHLTLFYAAYILAGGFGQGLALIPGVSIIFWPPVGILIAMLLLHPRFSWPWWVLAGCLAELTCNAVWFHSPLPFALIYYTGNALEALTAAWLLNRHSARVFRLESLEEVAAFIVLGAGVAPMVSATVIAATDAWLGKHPFMTAWPLVWLGDGTGLLVSTPLTVVAVQTWSERAKIPLLRLLETVVLVVILLGVSALSFKGYVPTVYMTLPPLLWVAVRFQLRGAATALGLITLMTAIFTATGKGEFTGPPELLHEKIVMLQTFLGISAISALVVATLSLQRQQALLTLSTVNAELEARIAERTATLRESEERLAAVLQQLPVAVGLMDTDGRLAVSNARMRLLVPERIPSRDPERLARWRAFTDDGRALEPAHWPGARALRGEVVVPGVEFLYTTDDGREIWTRVTTAPFRSAEGQISGAIVVIQDIDAVKRAEDALRNLNATLEQRVAERTAALAQAMAAQQRLEREAQRAEHFALLGRLAAGVSHELRNPLGAVFLNVDLLAEELAQPSPDSEAEVAESLAEIKANLARVEDLVEDYLSLVRVGALERTVQDLGAALQGWAVEFQALAATRGMTCQAEGLADLGVTAFHANTLRRALLNLVQNSLEAMLPGGTVTLRGRVTTDQVKLQVADTGSGIPAERLGQIFEPLQTTKPGGTGLGLYIVKEVLAAHGGQVTVESVVGKGTTFTLTLPRANKAAPLA